MCKKTNNTPVKHMDDKKPEEKKNPVTLEDIDDLIFGDERTVPSSR